ncbi:MAG: o-succinylbenzoate--CoA ligase [Endozoicomonadaceae bacterium]|nr:o-succinylbenzoate--CoA ligase [Endozoicomonadaceae bacterium]
MAKYCCPLRYHAGRTPVATALWLSERRISYDELDRLVMEVQRQLRAIGLQLGSHLAVISNNSLESLLLLMACLRSGIVFIPLNPRFPDRQLEGLLVSLDCTAYYLDEPMREQSLNRSGLRVVTLQWPNILNRCGGRSSLPNIVMDEERVCDLILTSGSSGQPKAAAHCYRNHYHSALGSQVLIPLAEGDAWLLSLPLYHVGGYAIVIRCLLAGAALVLLSPSQNLATLLKSRVPVTHLSLVNTQLYRLFTEPDTPLVESRLKLILMGGGYVSPDLVKYVETQGIRILTSYGLTETSSQACTGKPVFLGSQRLTSGRPLPYQEISISGEGEVLVGGEVLFMGYYRSGGVYHLPIENGWFATGDLGYLTDHGDLVVTGRRDNRFISGGENIQPEEIETALLSLNGVRQAVVVSVPDEVYGRRPVAFVDCDRPDNLNGLRSELALNLACFKLPEWIYSWPENWIDGRLKVNRHMFLALAERRIFPSASPR